MKKLIFILQLFSTFIFAQNINKYKITNLGEYPEAVHGIISSQQIINGELYFFGGKPAGDPYVCSNKGHKFNLATKTWTELPLKLAYGIADYGISCQYVDNKFFIGPGFANGNSNGWGSHNKIIKYDLVNNVSVETTSFPNVSRIWNTGNVLVNDKIYYLGGHTGSDRTEIYEFNPTDESLTFVQNMSFPLTTVNPTKISNDSIVYWVGDSYSRSKSLQILEISNKTNSVLSSILPTNERTYFHHKWYDEINRKIYMFQSWTENPKVYVYDIDNDIISETGITLSGWYSGTPVIQDERNNSIYALKYDGPGDETNELVKIDFFDSTDIQLKLDFESIVLNGNTLNNDNPVLNIKPNESISGSFSVTFYHNSSESSVFPLAVTPNWGEKQSVYWQEANDMANGSIHNGTISVNAPNIPGTYYIVIASSGEFNAGQIVSATNWNLPNLIWDNGDDFYDWSISTMQQAITNGMVNVPYSLVGGQVYSNVAARAIQIIVEESITPVLPFADNFDSNIREEWQIVGNNWTFNNGTANSSIPTTYQKEYIAVGDTSWADYTFEVDIMGTAGTDKHIKFRTLDPENYYFVHLRGPIQYNDLELGRRINNSWEVLSSKNYNVQNNVNYHLKIIVDGNNIKLFVNGVLELEVNDDTYASGGIALANLSGGYAPNNLVFDNVLVESIINSNIELEIPTLFVNTGDTLTIPINVTFPANKFYDSAELNFDGYFSELEFIEVDTNSTLIGRAGWTYTVNESNNLLLTAFSGANDINENGVFCNLKFVVTGEPCNYVPLRIESALFNTGVDSVLIKNGGVYIEPIPVYGDVDENTLIQAHDASLILKHLVGYDTLGCQALANADVTSDSTVSALDVSVIQQYLVNLIDSLPFRNTTGSLSSDGSIAMEDQSINSTEVLEIPLYLSNGNNILSFEGEFSFNSDELEFSNIIWSELLNDFTIEVNSQNGSIRFAGANSKPDGATGVFATIRFKVNNISEGTTEIILDRIRFNEGEVLRRSAKASILVGLDDGKNIQPKEFSLNQNYPNPFNPSTIISYAIPENSNVLIKVYDILGSEVATLVDETKNAGFYDVSFDASQLSNGIYFYKIQATSVNSATSNFVDVKKMILLK